MNALPSLSLLLCAASPAMAQQTQEEAFAQGKAYRDANAAAAASINPDNAAAVPGRQPETAEALAGLYGSSLQDAGEDKIQDCAARAPSRDAYADQECDAINYVRRNPVERPKVELSRNEPAIANGETIRAQPRAFTGDMPGLAGSYSACVDRTTRAPLQVETERCQVGHAITEGTCRRTLTLTYAWAPYAGQAGAEIRYARCPPGAVASVTRCLRPDGTDVGVADVPVFEDHWDDAECASFERDRGTIHP